jgi:REP element-mobilizing transposase RayT
MTLPQKNCRKKQKSFFPPPRREHGGSLGIGKRKEYRPMDTRLPVHLVLRSHKAKAHLALVHHQKEILRIINRMATKFHITIYEKNINFDHIHLLARGKKRRSLQDFFRAIAGLIARAVTGARKGRPFGKYWTFLLYSRLLNDWTRDFVNVSSYIVQNTLETLGLVPYKQRSRRSYG